jgi:hypothetical protein
MESITSKRTRETGDEEANHKYMIKRKEHDDLFLEVQFQRTYVSVDEST